MSAPIRGEASWAPLSALKIARREGGNTKPIGGGGGEKENL